MLCIGIWNYRLNSNGLVIQSLDGDVHITVIDDGPIICEYAIFQIKVDGKTQFGLLTTNASWGN